ncbi:hypothetical protein NUSPORA_02528 [Nucleospora cyclopteri]
MNKKLFLYNSLSKKLEEFIPFDENDVKIYICGPTVYDSPHIGHARTYISFDIMRRILEQYFKYQVTLVMNITNIDDKIINRANERDMSCSEISSIYENEFFEAMDKFKIIKPTYITRVDEYVEEIVSFIEKLVEDKMAYETNGSVYFNINEYKKKFKYNILRPETKKNETILEGEIVNADLKKSSNDFVLWKSSKENEPQYESPWGMGRPGWHIECSVMATSIFGSKLDIHAGGIDLSFPHHENEIAQCQGYFESKWVNYFLHTGHLNIEGRKMSKSLKNFLSIKDILEKYSPTTVRILFLLHSWHSVMNYDEDQLKRADQLKTKLFNFISNAKAVLTESKVIATLPKLSLSSNNTKAILSNVNRSVNSLDIKFYAELQVSKDKIDTHLKNNMNYSEALLEITNMITSLNTEMRNLHVDTLRAFLNYIKKILSIFGVISVEEDCNECEEQLALILNEFRSEIRQAAKTQSNSDKLFKLCDQVRDKLTELGYFIDDKQSASTIRKVQQE